MNVSSIIKEITPLSDKDCFYIIDRRKGEFTYPIHYHTEYELNFVQNAAGVRRVVGDSHEVIGEFDLVLITGENLEHAWEQHECHSHDIREITIQFSPKLLTSLYEKDQFTSIRKMMEKAKCGLCFSMNGILKVHHLLEELVSKDHGFYSFIQFLSILYELSLQEDCRTLSSSAFAKVETQAESRRIQKVQKFINEHYQEEIRLGQLANIADMTSTAFSRFFRLRTGKTLSEYITDIRIGNAGRMLVNTERTISEICYDCGFNNLSNFNRIFKKKKKCSPKEFRNNYKKTRIII